MLTKADYSYVTIADNTPVTVSVLAAWSLATEAARSGPSSWRAARCLYTGQHYLVAAGSCSYNACAESSNILHMYILLS